MWSSKLREFEQASGFTAPEASEEASIPEDQPNFTQDAGKMPIDTCMINFHLFSFLAVKELVGYGIGISRYDS